MPKKIAEQEARFELRVSKEWLRDLDRKRGGLSRAEYLRMLVSKA